MSRRVVITPALRSYLETALWCGHEYDDEGNPIGSLEHAYTVERFTQAAIREAARDLRNFLAENYDDILSLDAETHPLTRIAHDFFLTRNRHGAGFWDGGYPTDIAVRLTDSAHVYGTAEPYIHRKRLHWGG